MLKSPFKPNFLYLVGGSLRRLAGHDLNYKSIAFMNCEGVPKYDPLPNFKNTQNIAMVNCDEHFVTDWLKHQHFPGVKKIYLNSDPVEPDVLTPFHLPNIPIYLHDRFGLIKHQWEKIMPIDHVEILDDAEMEHQIINMGDNLGDADYICNVNTKSGNMATIGNFSDVLHYCKDIKGQYNNIGQNMTQFVPIPYNNIKNLDEIVNKKD